MPMPGASQPKRCTAFGRAPRATDRQALRAPCMSSDTATEEASGGTSEKSAAADQELVARFMEMLSAEKGAADNTRQAYARDLDDFLAFLARCRQRPLAAAEPADISAYLRAAAEAGLAAASRARRLSAI